jgi:excisionase family DNA binding protein
MSASKPLEPLLYRISQVAALLGLGESKIYQLVKDGELKAVRIGGSRIRIPHKSIEDYITSLEPVRITDEVPEGDVDAQPAAR